MRMAECGKGCELAAWSKQATQLRTHVAYLHSENDVQSTHPIVPDHGRAMAVTDARHNVIKKSVISTLLGHDVVD